MMDWSSKNILIILGVSFVFVVLCTIIFLILKRRNQNKVRQQNERVDNSYFRRFWYEKNRIESLLPHNSIPYLDAFTPGDKLSDFGSSFLKKVTDDWKQISTEIEKRKKEVKEREYEYKPQYKD